MTRIIPIVLAFFAGAGVAGGQTSAPASHPRVAVVLGSPALRSAVPRGVALRITRTRADQLGATHILAAKGYATVITVGVDRRTAVDPVARRYQRTRFISVPATRVALKRALVAAG
jgi:hypothetical protein